MSLKTKIQNYRDSDIEITWKDIGNKTVIVPLLVYFIDEEGKLLGSIGLDEVCGADITEETCALIAEAIRTTLDFTSVKPGTIRLVEEDRNLFMRVEYILSNILDSKLLN